MAYKVFTNGSVLNASEVNDNLMNQAVITFTNSTARGSAITSPVEGMLTYLEDSDTYEYWDGAAWTALVAATGSGSGNAIINGAFEINQRNFTSTTSNDVYTFDRWTNGAIGDGTSTFSSQAFTLGSAPITGYESANFLRIVSTGQTLSNAASFIDQRIEGVRSFANQTITFSFFAKSASGTPKIAIEFAQNFGSGGSATVNTYGGQVTISSSWERYSVTIAIPSIAGKTIGTTEFFSVRFWTSAGSTFDARTGSLGIQSNTFDIWGVQLEAGSTATPFRRNANSLQGELAACQRYYFRSTGGNFSKHGLGYAYNTTNASVQVTLPTTMRVAPTSVEHSALALAIDATSTTALTSLTLNASTAQVASVRPIVASGLTTNRPYELSNNNDPAGYIGFSAEL